MADILIVEDNRELSGLLCDFLKGERYSVAVAESGEQALAIYNREGVKLVILDIMLPGMDGFAVCKKIRSGGNTPILIVSAKTAKEDKLNGLLQGADDYIEKPYDIDIMLAKIDGIFKRRYAFDTLSDGELFVNRAARTVTKGGREIEMRAKEFDLLVLLLENRGRALDKEYIFEQIWGSDSFSEPQTLTVHIKWLREKIEENPKHPQKILTVWGVGYRYL
ncbi:MAG: response regulator transcription factor [Lachnospiraceae bacterium]|nr:response regulator transcription factor [Lachnospiraceae bacterium]